MAADTPPVPTPRKPSAKGMGSALKDPKVLLIVGIVAIGIALYFRSRQNANANLPAADGSGTPVVDPDYYPGGTQGAASSGGFDTTGAYGGYDAPPDWLTTAPEWITNLPTWWTNEPPSTNPANPAAPTVTLAPGESVYNPETGQLVTAPGSSNNGNTTGGGPPTTGTPGQAQGSPPSGNLATQVFGPPVHTGAVAVVNADKVGQTYTQTVGPHKGKKYKVVVKKSAAHGNKKWKYRDYFGPGTAGIAPQPIGPA